MAAPDNAIPLRNEAEAEWIEIKSKDSQELLNSKVECCCGFEGVLGELLCKPCDETVNNFWCPQCRSKGWSWA